MSTLQRGNEAEARVLLALVERDIPVLIPFGEGQPYDLVIDLECGFLRVQCKCSRFYRGCVLFNSCSTDHGLGRRDYRGLADLFGVYFPPAGEVFLVPVDEAATRATSLRLMPTRNCQQVGVRMADDYAVERWTREALAEFAARCSAQTLRSQTNSPFATARRP
jgi:hypothetical protein